MEGGQPVTLRAAGRRTDRHPAGGGCISGETAPLLFTALNNQFLECQWNQPMANLPVVIFRFARPI